MEFTDLKQENLINISFTDMMRVISSEETTEANKIAYIYLLNVIMDMDEKIQKITNTINELESKK
jgi:hypothetical protein